jgi:hypothetical protein
LYHRHPCNQQPGNGGVVKGLGTAARIAAIPEQITVYGAALLLAVGVLIGIIVGMMVGRSS